MTGIVPSLKTDHQIRILSQVIYSPSLAFIAPLGAYNSNHRHPKPPLYALRFHHTHTTWTIQLARPPGHRIALDALPMFFCKA
jgi:hypothetical protein